MDKITFNLNSIDISFGTRTVSLKPSVEIFTGEQKKRFSYFQDWLNIENMYHYNDNLFYVDSESADKWSLEKVVDSDGKEKQVNILTPGMSSDENVCIYKCKIYNPITQKFDEIECLPFKHLYQLLKVKLLIPAKK